MFSHCNLLSSTLETSPFFSRRKRNSFNNEVVGNFDTLNEPFYGILFLNMLLPTPDVIKYAIELVFSVISSLGGRSFGTVVIIYVFFGNFLPG